ncbi:hypothetical protein [Arsenophonus sp.]|uniref:hypothetical protein n=1 Tax=Arsenophonus sp. TaxID=1872640 RepID=UPI00285B87FC|nr:hypothetical protein [Arsenophonus sp.]MDR5615573.1 hypothetical protein [Arsenophonus sp.]
MELQQHNKTLTKEEIMRYSLSASEKSDVGIINLLEVTATYHTPQACFLMS